MAGTHVLEPSPATSQDAHIAASWNWKQTQDSDQAVWYGVQGSPAVAYPLQQSPPPCPLILMNLSSCMCVLVAIRQHRSENLRPYRERISVKQAPDKARTDSGEHVPSLLWASVSPPQGCFDLLISYRALPEAPPGLGMTQRSPS